MNIMKITKYTLVVITLALAAGVVIDSWLFRFEESPYFIKSWQDLIIAHVVVCAAWLASIMVPDNNAHTTHIDSEADRLF